MIKSKITKALFGSLLTYTTLWILTWYVLPFFVHPRVGNLTEYHQLENWDLSGHGIGDFDGDSQEDLISFTGCAFLSSVDTPSIPADKQCIAPGISQFVFDDKRVGEKYIDINRKDLNYTYTLEGYHAYLAKEPDQDWKIYVRYQNTLKAFDILPNGRLQETNSSLKQWINDKLYWFSYLFNFLAPIMAPIMYFFRDVFRFPNLEGLYPHYETLFFLLMTGLASILNRWASK